MRAITDILLSNGIPALDSNVLSLEKFGTTGMLNPVAVVVENADLKAH